ncbi:MAG: hypothetical protein ABIK89_04565 [Planctomycetota bacterium]
MSNVSQLTLPLGPMGSENQPGQHITNLKADRTFTLGGAKRLNATLQVFNVFNSNAAATVSYVSGPTYGNYSVITPPRVTRLGIKFSF